MEQKTCYRCGVEFDASDYIPGAPCVDCQEVYSGEWRKFNVVKADEAERRLKLVGELYHKKYSDRQIREALGLTEPQVRASRKILGLPGHTDLGGTAKWDDVGWSGEKSAEASKAYWDDPDRPVRRKGRGRAVEGPLSDSEEVREYKRQYFDAVFSGKNQTFQGHASPQKIDQRRVQH